MAKSAILSIRIVSNSTDAKAGLNRTARDLDRVSKGAAKNTVSLQRMNQQFDAMSNATLKVGMMATAMASATSQVAALGASLAPLAGFATVVPGAMGAAAAGIATFKVATSGLSDALKAAGKGEKEFAEATKDMAPAMVSVVRAMAAVNAQFAPVKRAVQEAFWNGMAGHVKALGSAYMPQVERGMTGLARSMNKLARGFAEGATQGARFGAVEASFRAAQRVVDSLAPAMAPLARGLSQIASASADLIPGFAGAERMGARFEAWAQRISGDGSLKRWLDGAVDAAKGLGAVFEGAGKIIGGVFNAAAGAHGGNALKGLADNLGKIGDAINKPEIQSKLQDAFRRANDLVGKAVGWFVKLLPYIVDMAPYVMALAAAWKVFAAAAAIVKGVQLVGEMSKLSGVLGGLFSGPIGWVILGVLALAAAFVVAYNKSETFRKVVDSAVHWVSEKLGELWKWMQDTFGPMWDTLKEKAAEWGPKLWQAAQDAWVKLQEVWAWLVKTFGPVWDALKEAAVSWGTVAVAAFGWLWQKAQELWVWIQQNLVPVWDQVKGPLLEFVKAAIEGLAQVLQWVAQLAKWIADHLGPAWGAVRPYVETLGNVIIAVMKGGVGAINWMVDAIRWLKDRFESVIGAARSVGDAISSAMAGAIGWIRSAISWADSLRQRLSNMPVVGGIFSMFGSGGMWARPAAPSALPEVGMPFYMTAAGLTFNAPAPLGGSSFKTAPTYVTNVTVEGALDPSATARQIKSILNRDARRDGAMTAGGSLW